MAIMNKIKPGLDIVLDVLKASLAAYPTSKFIESLLFQYQERGSLSKKQLEGLFLNLVLVSNSIQSLMISCRMFCIKN